MSKDLKFKQWDKVRMIKNIFPFSIGDELRIAEIDKSRPMPYFCCQIKGDNYGSWLCGDEIEKI